MKIIFLVRKKDTGQYLNQKGGWSKNAMSYRLKEFETKEAAEAAFPEGAACLVNKITKTEVVENSNLSIKYNFYLEDLNTKCFLNSANEFKVWAAIMPEAVFFDSEDAALDKAESLKLDLDAVRVIKIPYDSKHDDKVNRFSKLKK